MRGLRNELRWMILGPAFAVGFVGMGGSPATPGALARVLVTVFAAVFVLVLLGGLLQEARTQPASDENLLGATDAQPLGHETALDSP